MVNIGLCSIRSYSLNKKVILLCLSDNCINFFRPWGSRKVLSPSRWRRHLGKKGGILYKALFLEYRKFNLLYCIFLFFPYLSFYLPIYISVILLWTCFFFLKSRLLKANESIQPLLNLSRRLDKRSVGGFLFDLHSLVIGENTGY